MFTNLVIVCFQQFTGTPKENHIKFTNIGPSRVALIAPKPDAAGGSFAEVIPIAKPILECFSLRLSRKPTIISAAYIYSGLPVTYTNEPLINGRSPMNSCFAEPQPELTFGVRFRPNRGSVAYSFALIRARSRPCFAISRKTPPPHSQWPACQGRPSPLVSTVSSRLS